MASNAARSSVHTAGQRWTSSTQAGPFPPPALRERRHRSLARGLVAGTPAVRDYVRVPRGGGGAHGLGTQ
jgi:hypothetical protein